MKKINEDQVDFWRSEPGEFITQKVVQDERFRMFGTKVQVIASLPSDYWRDATAQEKEQWEDTYASAEKPLPETI